MESMTWHEAMQEYEECGIYIVCKDGKAVGWNYEERKKPNNCSNS